MRKLEYAGRGMIVDADTRNIVSPRQIVFEFNQMSEAIEKTDHADAPLSNGQRVRERK